MTIPLLGAFESTYQPAHDVDVAESTGHDKLWREDLELLRTSGVTKLRYPVRWHRIEPEEGSFDWSHTDEVLGYMQETGLEPIVDLVHHTSYPPWVGNFASPGFGDAFLRFAEAFARRYPWVPGYTLFNEPFTTFLLCGQEGIWAPHFKGLDGFLALVRNVFPALTAASRMYRDLLPAADHLYVDVCEGHSAGAIGGQASADYANDRRFLLTDLFVGLSVDPDRPFVRDVIRAGGEDVLEIEPGVIDTLGLDYYAHSQWQWTGPMPEGRNSVPSAPLSGLIREYWERYHLPCTLGETNIRGFASDRASWLKYTLEQCEIARDNGVPVTGYCWFPFIDSCDWDSLLFRCDRNVDPVGVYWLDEHLDRRPSSMSASFAMAARGLPASALPAYRFQPPVSRWLREWMPQMQHWEWLEPPADEVSTNRDAPDGTIEFSVSEVE